MGCDIHLYKEVFVDGKWQSADEWEYELGYKYVSKNTFTQRNYMLFGTLAKGVRNEVEESFGCRGAPEDISKDVGDVIDSWTYDAHSISYLYLHEIVDMYSKLEGTEQGSYVCHSLKEIINLFDSNIPHNKQRIVFFFDN